MAARARFELAHDGVKVRCVSASPPGNMVEMTGIRTPCPKIFSYYKSHSYLTSFVYIVLSILFTIYKSQEQVYAISRSLKAAGIDS